MQTFRGLSNKKGRFKRGIWRLED